MEKKQPFQHLRHLKLVVGACYELRKPVEGIRQFVVLEVLPLGNYRAGANAWYDVGANAWYDVKAMAPDGSISQWSFSDHVSLRRLS